MSRKDQQKITELAARLEAVIETAIDGIITIDQEGLIQRINKAGAEMFGYDRDELVGKNIKMLMGHEHSRNHDDYLHRYKTTGQAKIIGLGRVVEGKRKNGSFFPFRLAVSEVKFGNSMYYTGIIHDISDLKQAEDKILTLNQELEQKVEARTNELESVVNRLLSANRKLREQEQQLQKALQQQKDLNQLKSRFVSTASHEFRTPLSTILSSASLIGKYKSTEQQQKREKHIQRIEKAVSNLTGILDDFLSLSKLEEGKIDLRPSLIHVADFFTEIQSDIRSICSDISRVHLTCKDSNLVLQTDRKLLKNILINLLSNAIKYDVKGEICCAIQTENDQYLIVVSDQGIGIPKEEQKFLFDRFFRASNALPIKGTGLGLNIVKQYVELLQGDIIFESEEGEGTSFTIRLPKLSL